MRSLKKAVKMYLEGDLTDEIIGTMLMDCKDAEERDWWNSLVQTISLPLKLDMY